MDANIVTAIDNPDLLSAIVLLNCTDHSICEIADAEHGPHEVRQSFAVGAVFHRHQCDCRLTKRRMDLMCSPGRPHCRLACRSESSRRRSPWRSTQDEPF